MVGNILDIKIPEKLFTGNSADDVKKEYKRLAKEWHPDRCSNPMATETFAHIGTLYEAALDKLTLGSWRKGRVMTFTSKDGAKFNFKYLTVELFDLGTMYIGKQVIAYVCDKSNADLVDNALKMIKGIKYSSRDNMRETFEPSMPSLIKHVTLEDDRILVVLDRLSSGHNTTSILLRDIHQKGYGGKIPAKHVAWLMSRMYSLACFFQYNGLMYGGFFSDAVFVNPEHHRLFATGGWWYTAKLGQRMSALNVEVMSMTPSSIMATKLASTKLDLTSIKLLGRKLLGDVTGVTLSKNPDIPKPLLMWLTDPAGESAYEEYERWAKVLTDSFGPRKFIEMNLTIEGLYPEEK